MVTPVYFREAGKLGMIEVETSNHAEAISTVKAHMNGANQGAILALIKPAPVVVEPNHLGEGI